MTHATFLWLGQAIGAAALSVLQAATVGTMSLTNLIFDSSQATPTIYVGSQQLLNVQAGGVSFISNGTNTGSTVKDNGVVSNGSFTITCTGTGGNVKASGGAKYDTCISRLPLSSSGVITMASFEFIGTPVASVNYDCGVVKGLNAGTGTVLWNNIVSASGSTSLVEENHFSGGLVPNGVVNGVDYFKCGTLVNPGAGLNAKVRLWYYDSTAE